MVANNYHIIVPFFSVADIQNDLIYWMSSQSGPIADFSVINNITTIQMSYENVTNRTDIQVQFFYE